MSLPPNPLEGQVEMWLHQLINKGAGIVPFLTTVSLIKDIKCQHTHRERSLQMGPGEAVLSGGDGPGIERDRARW